MDAGQLTAAYRTAYRDFLQETADTLRDRHHPRGRRHRPVRRPRPAGGQGPQRRRRPWGALLVPRRHGTGLPGLPLAPTRPTTTDSSPTASRPFISGLRLNLVSTAPGTERSCHRGRCESGVRRAAPGCGLAGLGTADRQSSGLPAPVSVRDPSRAGVRSRLHEAVPAPARRRRPHRHHPRRPRHPPSRMGRRRWLESGQRHGLRPRPGERLHAPGIEDAVQGGGGALSTLSMKRMPSASWAGAWGEASLSRLYQRPSAFLIFNGGRCRMAMLSGPPTAEAG